MTDENSGADHSEQRGLISQWRRYRGLMHESRNADEAVRRTSGGESRAQVRELLLAEIRARGLPVPPEPLLAVRVEAIMDKQDPVTRARYSARGFGALLGAAGDAIRDLKNSFEDFTPQPAGGRRLYLVREDKSRPATEVILDPGAEQWLAHGDIKERGEPGHWSEIHTWLDTEEAEDQTNLVAVHVRADRVGVLGEPDARGYAQVMATARGKNQVAVVVGIRSKDPAGRWHLQIYRPERPPDGGL
jgi:hypothetical protein